jgi:aquaporin Z
MDARKLLAEAIGTFILVLLGSMSIIGTLATQGPILVIVPLGFGIGLLAAIAVTGHVSGGHYNPAVTLGAVLDGRIDPISAVGYVIAQVVGAVIASGTLLLVTGAKSAVAGTRNTPGLNEWGAFAVEVILTAIFLAVILTITKKAASHAVFVIPLTLLVIHVVGIPFSGASVNPARSLGPALVSANLESLWIYLTAPFVGSVIGWAVYRLLDEE